MRIIAIFSLWDSSRATSRSIQYLAFLVSLQMFSLVSLARILYISFWIFREICLAFLRALCRTIFAICSFIGAKNFINLINTSVGLCDRLIIAMRMTFDSLNLSLKLLQVLKNLFKIYTIWSYLITQVRFRFKGTCIDFS